MSLPRYRARLWLILALGPCGCFAPTTTTRIVAGQVHVGRYISPQAYAHVLSAAVLEREGDLRSARAAYFAAASDDDRSPEIWTRIGAIDCRLQDAASERAFERAEALDPSYEPLWRERARCLLDRGNAAVALETVKRAVALDPAQTDSTDLAARALELLGDSDSAERWRRGLRLASLTNQKASESERTDRADATHQINFAVIDAALTEPALDHARALALEAGLTASDLALHAVEIGAFKQALLQADLILSANPSDANARVAALVAADLSADEARFKAFLLTPPGPLQLNDHARTLLNALLIRRIGDPRVRH